MNTDDGLTRRLSAILSADVEGYSRLMREDEEATVRTITAYRTAMAHLIQQYRGRVVDSPGDNILAEFTSVVDAVNCAVEIQRELAERNAELPENRRMSFRIGINLGDVLEEGDRIYGDGVNVAARMEGLADAGEICISGTVYDAIESKTGLEYEFLGEHEVKNIDKPIRAYKVLSFPGAAAHRVVKAKRALGRTWRNAVIAGIAILVIAVGLGIWNFYLRHPPIEPASADKMAFPLPDKPSIAVLPFDNMSGDAGQDYLADGISENIISGLSRISQLFVIARNSTFTYKGKPVKVQQVSQELGVRYVLEGSVKKSGSRLRITAQLIDAIKGNHLWSETYDRRLEDIFAVEDEVTKNIVAALNVELTQGEQARTAAKGTDNLEAYLKFMQAQENVYRHTMESNALAQQLAQEALTLDPTYAPASRVLGITHMHDILLGRSKSPKESLGKAIALVKKAIELDDQDGESHASLGFLLVMIREYDKAVAEVERGVALEPNVADIYGWSGIIYRYVGRWEDAVTAYEKAIRLNPIPPDFYLQGLGLAYAWTGRYEEGIRVLKRAVQNAPDSPYGHLFAAAAYSMAGRDEEARREADEVLRLNPTFSLEKWGKSLKYKNRDDQERLMSALRKAGLPETPPLPLPDKPSIAVLPFKNLSGDPEQEYFSDGMTDDITTDLSKISGLMVISSNSAFTYKGKEIKIPVIAKELGVQYVLEGSVRRAGSEVRINAQLIDAVSDHHVWADRFDAKNENIFDLQDRITERIVSALSVKLSDPEQKGITDMGTDSFPAYDAYLKGMNHMRKFTPKDYAKAIGHFEKAIEMDRNYSQAYANLAYTYMSSLQGGKTFWDEMGKDFPTARLLARYYLELSMKKPTSRTYQVFARMELFKRNFDSAIDYAERAVAMAPNDADALESLARTMVFSGNPVEAIQFYKRSIMLDPLHKSTGGIGWAYFTMGDHEQAVKYIEKQLKDYPETYGIRATLAAAYAFLGNDIKAKEAFEEFYT